MFQRRQQGNNCRQTWRLLLVLLAVFAASAQQLVAQTHWHVPAATSVVGAGSPEDGAGKHDDCLWCQVAAHASAAAPPVSLQALVAADAFEFRVSVAHHSVVVPRPAHAWQSRGPPAG